MLEVRETTAVLPLISDSVPVPLIVPFAPQVNKPTTIKLSMPVSVPPVSVRLGRASVAGVPELKVAMPPSMAKAPIAVMGASKLTVPP